MNMNGKVALVTGAAVGIGRAVAIRLSRLGAGVAITDIDAEGLDSVRREIEAQGREVLSFVCDVCDETMVQHVVEQTRQRMGRLDILINNAALWKSFEGFTETSTEKWRRYLDVNVASVAGVYGNGRMVAYSATKGAVISMTKALAKEVAAKGITVNCVSPGTVSPSENPDMNHTQETPTCYMGRTGSDNENANLICWLASEESSYVCGENIQIDGCRKKL